MATPLSRRLHFILLICGELVSGQIHYSIPEELEHGAFVGNIAEDLGLSIREMTGRKFKLVYDDGMQLLKVNMGNGILFVNQRIDREFLCGQSSTCSVSLDVALENPLEMHRVNVEILDVNDNSPSFAKNRYYLQVSEVTAVGAFFRLDSAHDPDVGSNCVNIYKISTNKHFGLKTHTRSDGSKIAELVLETPLDREKHSTIHVTLTAFDGGIPHRSGNAEIIITVLDFNDNTPVFDHKIYSVNIMENAPVGHLVLTINATDLDEGANGEVKYILRSDANQRVQELFRLDPISGQIRVQGSLDYEEKRIYELEVEAVDNGTPILTARAEILVELIDVNDNPPELKISSLSRKVREDAAFGSVVAIISVIDQDSGANGQVQCQLPPNIPFKLQKSFNNQYKLVISDKLDREMTPYYNICISAWDAGSPRLSTKRTILVSISDINDNVPRFTQASYNVFLMENNIPGTSIFAVTAFDPDLDKNSKLSYFLLEYRREDVSRSGDVTVNSETGHIYALRSFDYEIRKEIQIKIQAQDAGTPPLSSTAIVNIVILDQNDNAPVIIAPSKYNSSTAMEVVPMSAYPGYLVTKVIATDADSGQNARLSYQLVEATDRNMFSVGITSGEIRTTRRFRDHDVPIQNVLILVKDKGQPSLSSTVTIVISVLPNVTENFSERKNTPRNPGLFSDTNLLLILCFGLTSSIFLLIICFLIALKCKQDRNVYGYTFGTCCSRQRNSTDAFHGRSVPKANLSYPETPAPIRDSYNYTVCLSPESAQSDFLFLKSCHPTLPLDEINVVDRGK
ncbi:protocadherin-10-like [Scyliorhinus canicula]|uniref:protocadherin-10-like n=1 Tax=Scyliorhinus canicula TaxID=7830 RepID=UPI0018F7833E|nr:protocadherin-10-like [Scyliorhinus canicula]